MEEGPGGLDGAARGLEVKSRDGAETGTTDQPGSSTFGVTPPPMTFRRHRVGPAILT